MAQMYKVFFKEKTVYLTNNYNINFKNTNGIFFTYKSISELNELWHFFIAATDVENLFVISSDLDKLIDDFFSFFNYIDAAGGLVINENEEYLIINRLGKWDLPKGKVEQGEKFQHAALREVEEECGLSGLEITGELPSTFHTYFLADKQMLKQTHWYKMNYKGKELPLPQTEENISKVMWVSPEDMAFVLKNTYPSIVDVLNNGIEEISSFSF